MLAPPTPTIHDWVAGARPRTLPAAVVPVAVGAGVAVGTDGAEVVWWRVLAALSTNGKQRQIDVAQTTSIDVSTMSRLMTRLTRLGLVTRTRSDISNREVNVELTRKGRALVNRLIPRARNLEGEAVAGLRARGGRYALMRKSTARRQLS